MRSGFTNLRYISWGERIYGKKPVLATSRGVWEFQFILGGMAKPTTANEHLSGSLSPVLYVFHPDSVHGWSDEPAGVSEVFVLHFREVPDELAMFVNPSKHASVPLSQEKLDMILPRLSQLKSSEELYTVRVSLLIQKLLIEMTDLAVGQREESHFLINSTDKVDRTLHWMLQNIHHGPTVEMAARAVGVSPTHLRRLFVDAGRLSPKAELIRLKMESAKRGLQEGWTQQYVADYLGYSDVSTFARAFRKECGIPPGDWIKSNRLGR